MTQSMVDCASQYFADVAECDRLYQEAKDNCLGSPECIQAALAMRSDCEDEAYLKYLNCLTQSGIALTKSQKLLMWQAGHVRTMRAMCAPGLADG